MYTRARILKSLKAKVLTAFASFALLLGVGAAVTTVAAQQQNEVVETKAASGDFTGVYVYSNASGSWTDYASLADDGTYWRGFAKMGQNVQFKVRGSYSDSTYDYAGYRDTLDGTYFGNADTSKWGGANIKIKLEKTGVYYFKVNGQNFHTWGKDDAEGGKSAIWWNGDSSIEYKDIPVLRGSIGGTNYWSSDDLKFTANTGNQTFTYSTTLHENDQIKVYYPSGGNDAQKWIGYHTNLSSDYFIGYNEGDVSGETAIGMNIRIKKTGNYTFSIGTKLFTHGNNSYLWAADGDSTIAFADLTTNVTFDKQEGTGGTDSTTVTYGANMATIAVPTRTGYVFGGYYTEPSGGGTKYYNADGTYAKAWDIEDATKTLYAKWEAGKFAITLDNQSASTSGTATIYEKYNDGFYLDSACSTQRMSTSANPISVPTKTGYTFGGYYTETGGSGTQYIDASGKLTSSAVTTHFSAAGKLYAKWTAQTYYINYYDQGGDTFSGTHADGHPTTHTYGSATALMSASKTGYIFGGWFTNSECTGSAITSLGATAYTDDVNLYALWTADKYTITLNNQSATSAGTAYIYEKYNDGFYLDSACSTQKMSTSANPIAVLPTRNGYVFGGYYTETGGNGTQYIDAGGYLTSSAVATNFSDAGTLYAKWTVGKYTLTLNDQGATTAGTSAIYEKYTDGFYLDAACTSQKMSGSTNKITTPKKNGYNFQGYYTSTGGKGTLCINSDGSIKTDLSSTYFSSNEYLYAYWTIGSFEVTITAGTGISSVFLSTDDDATSGSPSRTSFEFNTTVYGFAVLAAGYAHQGTWDLVSGTADTAGAIYCVGSLTVATSGNDFGTKTPISGESDAVDFANTFIGALDGNEEGVCDSQGHTDTGELATAWAALKDDYGDLKGYVQYWFGTGVSEQDDIEAMLALYDYVCGKYGTSGLNLLGDKPDFLNRRPSVPASPALVPGAPKGNESPLTITLWIVLGAGMLGLGAIGTAYFVSKKKKRTQVR